MSPVTQIPAARHDAQISCDVCDTGDGLDTKCVRVSMAYVRGVTRRASRWT